jgi:hypothetical protein
VSAPTDECPYRLAVTRKSNSDLTLLLFLFLDPGFGKEAVSSLHAAVACNSSGVSMKTAPTI